MTEANGDDLSRDAPETAGRNADAGVQDGAKRRAAAGAGALPVALAVLALIAGGYAAWWVWLTDRSEDNRQTELRRQLEALDARVNANERRSARSNELAATLRDQLAENERLRERMREDLVTLADRGTRAEALLADLARQQRGPREHLALTDAGLMLGQAQARLRLFGDRQGARTALALAESALAGAGSELSDLRAAVADAAAALAADPRPSLSQLLGELDEMEQTIETLGLRVVRPDLSGNDGAGSGQGWWARQIDRLDHLVTVRRESDGEAEAAPTKSAVRRALQRARLAALDNDAGTLARALAATRASLLACCEIDSVQAMMVRLERLSSLDWNAPLPDLGTLRERLDNRSAIERERTHRADSAAMAADAADGVPEDTP